MKKKPNSFRISIIRVATTCLHVHPCSATCRKGLQTPAQTLNPRASSNIHIYTQRVKQRAVLLFGLILPPLRCCSLRLTALRFKSLCCTQLPAQDFLIRVGDLASASPCNKSLSLSGAALLSGISLSEP